MSLTTLPAEEEQQSDLEAARRHNHESPYVKDEDGEFNLIKNPNLSNTNEVVGVPFADSIERMRMRVPGDVPGLGKMSHEVAKLRSELKTRTLPELQTVLERQKKILANKSLVNRLPDKGEKTKLNVAAIEKLIAEREGEKDLALDMEKLKINTEKMEWKNRFLDSDDDSDPETDGPVSNPLAVLAQGVVPPISSKARSDVDKDVQNGSADIERFAHSQCVKVDEVITKERFVPSNSVRHSTLDAELRAQLGNGGKTATTNESVPVNPGTPNMPLPPVYSCKTKLLTLGDSLKLQLEQEKLLKETQMKHAQERLANSRNMVKGVQVEQGRFQDYREPDEDSGGEEEDSGDEGVGVVGVTVVTDE